MGEVRLDRNFVDENQVFTATSLTKHRNFVDEKIGEIATSLTKKQCSSIIFNIYSIDIKGSARFKLADPSWLKGSVSNTHPCFTKSLPFLYHFHGGHEHDDFRQYINFC